jgi:hypothetical protein
MQQHAHDTSDPAVSSLPESRAGDAVQRSVPDGALAPRDWSELGRRVLAEALRRATHKPAGSSGLPLLLRSLPVVESAKEGIRGSAASGRRDGPSATPVTTPPCLILHPCPPEPEVLP